MEKIRIALLSLGVLLTVVLLVNSVGKTQQNGQKLGAQTHTRYYGGIIPHHLLADSLITDFFKRVQPQDPSRILLIGPNHEEAGNALIVTTVDSINTPESTVEVEQNSINQLISSIDAEVNDSIVEQEHAITAIVPYISSFTPNATVIPLIVSNKATEEELHKLASTISTTIDQDTLIIGAFDFSHYLKRDDAALNDQKTLTLIKERNYQQLLSLSNAYTDSPAALVLFLKLMELNGSDTMEIIANTNSGILLDDAYVETTSYFEIGFIQ